MGSDSLVHLFQVATPLQSAGASTTLISYLEWSLIGVVEPVDLSTIVKFVDPIRKSGRYTWEFLSSFATKNGPNSLTKALAFDPDL